MKGAIQDGHIPLNKYVLSFLGLPPLTPTKMSGIEEELETVDLPDRTKASGGQTKSVEFTIMLPMHHRIEQAAMEAWYREGQDPVTPGYKKSGTLLLQSIYNDRPPVIRTLMRCFVYKRKDPDVEMKNEGEMAEVEWSISADLVIPTP